jgi:molecular chaperone GrpE (heat shock protein)
MLAVLDDTDRAIATVGDDDDSSVADGLRLIRSRLWQELTAAGVSQISTDALFDPNLHEAIATIPATDEIPAKSIVSVLEPGYRFKERIVKAARVVVAASPMSDSEE